MSKIIDTQEIENFTAQLQELGLDKKEAMVYLALLSLGEVGTTAIANKTKLHRQNIYDALSSLEGKGLVGHSVVRGKKRFVGRSPSRIVSLLDHKKQVAEALATRIEKTLTTTDAQEFEAYRGKESFVANELQMIKNMKVGSKIYVLGGAGDKYIESMGIHFNEYEFQRLKKKIEVLYIGNSQQIKTLLEHHGERPLFSYRLLPQTLSGELNIAIYENCFSLSMFGTPVTSILIKSSKITKSYADFFMGLWEISK